MHQQNERKRGNKMSNPIESQEEAAQAWDLPAHRETSTSGVRTLEILEIARSEARQDAMDGDYKDYAAALDRALQRQGIDLGVCGASTPRAFMDTFKREWAQSRAEKMRA
jgi:hypothetical protein